MTILRYLYVTWVAFVFIFWMIVILPFLILPYLFGIKVGGDIAYKGLKVWSYLFAWFTFIRFKVHGRDKVDKSSAKIVVSNHTSFIDAPAFAIAMPGQCRPLGKIEMTKFPIFGWIYRMNVVLVDRSSKESRQSSIVELMKVIEKNISILIFPEGTMNRGDVILQPFYNGAFRLACQLNVKIQPLVIEDAIKLMPRSGGFKISPGKVNIHFLDEISPEGLNDEQLKELTFSQMYNFLNRKKVT